MTKQIRSLTKIAGRENALLLLDIPDSGSFYVCDAGGAAEAVTAATVKTFMRAVQDGSVEKRKFSR